MSIEIWLAFAAASAVLPIVAGPTLLTVLKLSLSRGSRSSGVAGVWALRARRAS